MATSKKQPQAPEGFEEVATGHSGWIHVIEGRPIQGELIGFEERPDRDGYQYLIRLEAKAPGKKKDEEGETETFDYEPGTVVALNETKLLSKALRRYVNAVDVKGNPVTARVWILPLALEPLRAGSGTYRDYTVKVDPKAKPGSLPKTDTGDDIPF